MKRFTVIAYDIADDKRRNRIAKLLGDYGYRANYSVFECFVNETELEKIKTEMVKHLKPKHDTVLFYYLCKNCIEKTERLGIAPEPEKTVKSV